MATEFDKPELFSAENIYDLSSTSLTRIYYSMPAEVRSLAKQYHNQVITKIRGIPTAVKLSNATNIIKLSIY